MCILATPLTLHCAALQVLLCAGGLLELSEGPLRFLAVAWAAATLGFAFHGAISSNYAIGASGVAYGVTWCQMAILALNWAEMPCRLPRLGAALALALLETITYNTAYEPTIAYGAHWGGAAAGIATGTVLASNVKLRQFEVYLNWGGVLLYALLVVIALGYGQYAAAGLASALIPVLVASAAAQTLAFQRGDTELADARVAVPKPSGGGRFGTRSQSRRIPVGADGLECNSGGGTSNLGGREGPESRQFV